MIPTVSLFLLFPFFVVSAMVESWVLRRLWPTVPRRRIRTTAWLANGLSYALLMVYVGVGLHQALGIRA
jgi:hypothetical protein